MTATTFWVGALIVGAMILVGLGAALLVSVQVLGPHARRATRARDL